MRDLSDYHVMVKRVRDKIEVMYHEKRKFILTQEWRRKIK
jgi:hypothetical protein